MSELKAHLFICTNSPDKVGKCGNKGSEELRKSLKLRCKKELWGQHVRINSAGCLDKCEQGIAAVLYPQNEWFLDLTKADEDKLFDAVRGEACKIETRGAGVR